MVNFILGMIIGGCITLVVMACIIVGKDGE